MVALLTKEILHNIRKEFRKDINIKACYLTEALAYGYGYKTFASLLHNIDSIEIQNINYIEVYKRACELSKNQYDSQRFISKLYDTFNRNNNISPIEKIYKEQFELHTIFNTNVEKYLSKLPSIYHDNVRYIVNEGREYKTRSHKRYINLWNDTNNPPLVWNVDEQKIEPLHEYEVLYIPLEAYIILLDYMEVNMMQGDTTENNFKKINNPKIILYIIEQTASEKPEWYKNILYDKYTQIFSIISDSSNFMLFDKIRCFLHPLFYQSLPENLSHYFYIRQYKIYLKMLKKYHQSKYKEMASDLHFLILRLSHGLILDKNSNIITVEQKARMYGYLETLKHYHDTNIINLFSEIIFKPKDNVIFGKGLYELNSLSDIELENIYTSILTS